MDGKRLYYSRWPHRERALDLYSLVVAPSWTPTSHVTGSPQGMAMAGQGTLLCQDRRIESLSLTQGVAMWHAKVAA